MRYGAAAMTDDQVTRLHAALAARVRSLISENYATDTEAAARMGISAPRLSRIVNGSESVYGAVVKLDEQLRSGGMDPMRLLMLEDDGLTEEGQRAARAVQALSPAVRAFALHLLESLSDLDAALPNGADLADLETLRATNPVTRRIVIDGLKHQQRD